MSEHGLPDAVVIERSFDAPVDLIWQMWTDPEHFKAWYGPDGATIPVRRWTSALAARVWCAWRCNLQLAPCRCGSRVNIARSSRTSDSSIRKPCATRTASCHRRRTWECPPGHPTTTEVRVDFTDVGGRTTIVMTHTGIPADSPGATGWAMALDKLVAHVKAHGATEVRRRGANP